MRASYRYALAVALATALAVGIGVWLGTRPTPAPPAPAPPLEHAAASPDGPASTPADRAGALDRIEATEAVEFGAEEAARRRRQRERMLDLRLGGHE